MLVLGLCCLSFTYPKTGKKDNGRSLSTMSKDQTLANAIMDCQSFAVNAARETKGVQQATAVF